ncbi:hypothetical protein A3F66_07055 [candidate division TM6 bacterium RIFCSPHIGHO2_12_FULL_32_22]|nr:MAG: hypothetical protein A3F66_07055 [candidate division TM6 bacterium RIFCSPHIGHO2_12_FULL_32_22]
MAKLQTFLDFEQEPEKIIIPKEEIWKDITGFENKYQVSNLGRVRSLTRQVKIKNKFRIVDGKILKNRINYTIRKKSVFRKIDYIETRLGSDKSHNRFKVARLVAKAFLDIPWENFKVSFKDKDKTNVCADNIIVKENIIPQYSEKHIGKIYGNLTVIDRNKETKSWILKCLCGN